MKKSVPVKILMVDDEPGILSGFSYILKLEGYDVYPASSTEEAVAFIENHEFDLFILDVNMPWGIGGFGLAQYIKKKFKKQNPFIIFFSGYNTMENVTDGLELGVDFIHKTVHHTEFIARVRAALRTRATFLELKAKTEGNISALVKSPTLPVFLCHAEEDKRRTRNLDKKLAEVGITTWFDEKDLLPGQDWEFEIKSAIRSSAIFLACLSPRSIDKTGYVQKEISLALDTLEFMPQGEIFIIPVLFEFCTIPERLLKRQGVKLYNKNGHEKLIKTIKSQLERKYLSAEFTSTLFKH